MEPDVAALLPEDTSFLADYEAYKRIFPYDRRTNIVVIDAPGADQAANAQRVLSERLRAEHGALFNAVRAPGYDDFRATHGLLYLSVEELRAIISDAIRARPVLAQLSKDPSLGGIANLIEDGLSPQALEFGAAPELARLFDFITASANDLAAGKPNGTSWSTFFLGPKAAPMRRLILAQGRLDGPEETVGADTGSLIRREAVALGLTSENGFEVRLTGRGPLSAEETNAAIADVQLAGMISFAMLAIILWAGFRSFKVIFATLFTVAMGLTWTMGFATIAVGQLNILSLVFAVLFIGLGVDFAIHAALRFLEYPQAKTPAEAAEGSIRAGAGALGLCAVTSAIGFLAFLPTEYRGLAELGVISAGGMILAYGASLTILPATLILMGTTSNGTRPLLGVETIVGLIGKPRLTRGLSIGALALGALLAAVGSQVGFNFNTLALKDPRSDAISAFADLQADGVATAYSLSIAFPNRTEAEAARANLSALPAVAAVEGPSDLVPDDQAEKLALIDELSIQLWPAIRNNRPWRAPAPDTAVASLDRMKMLATRATDLPAPLDRAALALVAALEPLSGSKAAVAFDQRLASGIPPLVTRMQRALEADGITLDTLPNEERGRYLAPTGEARLKVLPNADLTDYRSLRVFVEAVSELHPNATGRPKLEYETGAIVVTAFLSAIGLALVAIGVVLSIVLRRARDVALVMAPLALAGAVTLGFSVLVQEPLNMASVIVLPLILGLGVDNGIHFVMRWRESGDVRQVLRGATIRAIAMSGLTTFASFGTLMIAGNGAISSMGVMLTVGIASILIAMLVILPLIVSLLSHE